MAEKKPTKDRILEAALTLFAEKGYDGVGVDLIAERVGLKGPSLYKHFKGKADILDALIEQASAHYEANFGSAAHLGRIPDSTGELVEMALNRIGFTMHDPTIRKVRLVLMMEQFRNNKIAELTTLHHIDGIQRMYALIFEEMMKKGILCRDDPYQLAMEFAAPVSLLIHMVDRQPEREQEAMQRIESHLRHFVTVYGTNKIKNQ